MTRRVALGVLAFLLLAPVALARADTADVAITNNAYTPEFTRIHVGDSVEWTNSETGLLPSRKNTHTVTADDGTFDSGQIKPGETFTLRFVRAGTFPCSCTIHPNMHGTVIVIAPATASPKATPTPTRSARATPTATPSKSTSPSATPTPSATESIVAGGELGAGGSSAGVILSVAIVAIAVLTLLGWLVYVRYLRET
ncbi:MAG: cupredoxin domain-containing protein [Actinomycetota bacterium]